MNLGDPNHDILNNGILDRSLPPAVEVIGLSYQYQDGTQALLDVTFTLGSHQTVALLGPNGSGKTTFALHLNGLLRGKGTVRIDGMEISDRNLPEIRRRVGLVMQDADNQLFMPTVIEDVAFGPMTAGMSSEAALSRARSSLELVGMLERADKAPYHLSAGEKKRVAIAGILASNPTLLILDEPTTFLDPPGRRSLSQLLAQLPQAKILITHDVAFASSLTDQAVFFNKGSIAARGSLITIVQQFGW